MTVVIELRGLEVHGFHGVLEEERRVGQRFLVDLELEPVHDGAAASDRIEDTVDYRDVVTVVQEVSSRTSYRLLEAFAASIADELLDRLPLRSVRVRVRKPDVVLSGAGRARRGRRAAEPRPGGAGLAVSRLTSGRRRSRGPDPERQPVRRLRSSPSAGRP